jgi:multicomponent Na+:H+ antiporter subunit D
MLLWLVIIPILTAVVIYALYYTKASRAVAVTVQTALTCGSFYFFLMSKNGEVVTIIGNYEGVMGIILRADTLSAVFLLLTSFVFLFTVLYSIREQHLGRLFWFLLFIWEGLLFGIFLSGDFFNIFVMAEVSTVVISVLIMLKRDNRSMYDGMVYLMLNTVAIQFYLFGTGYIYKLTGVLDINTAAQVIAGLDTQSLILPYALIITSISLKCALMPLFSWLPKAHGTPGAPASVSAILSGLHIKSGVYLFIRFQAVFHNVAVPEFFLIIGIITGIAGFIFALSQSDIKLILAYHTISQIGMIMIGLNVADTNSYIGGVYHIISHTLFKATLFLCAGVIIDVYGTRDISAIRGVLKRMPLVGISAIMAILGITGAPFFNGSISKYFIMSGSNVLVSGAIIFINLGTIISFIKFSSMLFGRHNGEQNEVKPGICQQAAVLILGAFCFIGGIFGVQFIWFLFAIDVSVDAIGYLQKTVFFIVSAAAGFFIYKYFVSTSVIFRRIREVELGFRGTCIFMGMFFAIVLTVTRLFLA